MKKPINILKSAKPLYIYAISFLCLSVAFGWLYYSWFVAKPRLDSYFSDLAKNGNEIAIQTLSIIDSYIFAMQFMVILLIGAFGIVIHLTRSINKFLEGMD